MTEEADIVARLREQPGDERAWADFYAYYRRQIIAVLFFRGIRTAMDQEDLAAEVFFRFLIDSPWHEDWTSLPSSPEIRKHLLGRTSSIAWHARARSQRHATIESELSRIADVATAAAPFVDFEHVLDNLSEGDRELAILYYRTGISLAEVADHYGITYPAAGVRLHRLRRRIMAIIREKPFSKK